MKILLQNIQLTATKYSVVLDCVNTMALQDVKYVFSLFIPAIHICVLLCLKTRPVEILEFCIE